MTQPKHGDKEPTSIVHLGKKFSSTHYIKISDLECQSIKKDFFKKPKLSQVKRELYNIHYKNSIKIGKLTEYFFSEEIYNTRLYTSKWSINEFFESNDLIRFAYAKVKNCSDFYKEEDGLIKNIKTVLRLSPSRTAAKVSNYPLKSVKDILKKYSKEARSGYYDYSCGWGVRLIGAMSSNVKYYGTDPNFKLTQKLNEMGELYNKVTQAEAQYKIYTQGSEKFIPELENNIGIAFSSPPYFDLEDYKTGEQSIKGRSYKLWLEEYWRETVKNIIKYLKEDGVMLLNIKSFEKYNLLEDMKDICTSEGLLYIESLELKNIQRIHLKHSNVSSDEQILVFRKHPEVIEDNWDW